LPSVRWVSGSGTPGSFCLDFGVLWASGACCLGYHGRPLCCHGLSPVLGFACSVEFGHRPCSLRIRLESLTGGPCLSSPWWAAGSVQYPASLPKIHQVRWIHQERFPYQGRYPPTTWPDTVEDDGDDDDIDGVKDGKFSDRCFSGSDAVWAFCLASGGLSGIIWIPFERRVSSGTPLGSLWAWVPPDPVWGPRAASAFSHS
jgi:hypothetical protein